MQLEKGLKTKCLETLIIIAPPLGEGYNFNAMNTYSILLKSRE